METTVSSVWTKSKLLVKSGIIGLILLVLQIPSYYVKELIEERETRQKEAMNEVSSKWAGKQNIMGPVLVIPYWQSVNSGDTQQEKTKRLAYFLPDQLNIDAAVTPQEKYRGIYKVMLYTSAVKMNGSFSSLQLQKLGLAPEDMLWNEAYIRMSTSDNKGLNDEVKLSVNDTTLTVSAFAVENAKDQGLYAPLQLTSVEDAQNLRFSTQFSVNGSEQLLFAPIGKATTVHLSSGWPHPSFNGNSLPQTTAIKDSGFTATWKSMGHERSFPQQWKDDAYSINNYGKVNAVSSSAFGVDLFIPVSSYQKTMRSVKYSLLCLLLTFAAFFLIETTNKKSAHPFHYGLIGLALILFYTLLLSFSEYIGFNPAYVIASVCTIGLIGWFVKGILASGKLAVLIATMLVLLYGYVFTILQLQDYSLLLGSLGLFATLAVIMHYSKKFQW
ncbi:MAG TPA: cell envelope integrity protein CreD [Flavisolibacter sp.]|nr:cell envelope integrity protein CreD [Flavisolibacter sp.]